MKSLTTTTLPKAPARLPMLAEMHEMSGRAFLEAIWELNEENRSPRPLTPAEMDDLFAEGMREALEEVRAKAPQSLRSNKSPRIQHACGPGSRTAAITTAGKG